MIAGSSPTRRVSPLLSLIAVLAGVVGAYGVWWTNDDAYISFRYADHLAHGLGLVYNVGERVEGYSNFLWTLWCALGLRLGASPEMWANVSGIACFAATIALLAVLPALRRSTVAPLVPIAALGFALHRYASIFATGGLETSLFTLLVTGGYALLAVGTPSTRRIAIAGGVFGLMALTRPDGIVLAVLAAAWLVVSLRSRRALLAFAGVLVAILVPYAAWKLSYYGDLLPNTYYAKSAGRAWWSQGFTYARLYFTTYWPLVLGVPLAFVALWRPPAPREGEPPTRSGVLDPANAPLVLAALLAIGDTVYVMRVGGDFMFARFLVPVTPLYLILLEIGIDRLVPDRIVPRALAAAVPLLAIAFARSPFQGKQDVSGIVDEWLYYPSWERDSKRELGEMLANYGKGLPLRVACSGGQAIIGYYGRVPTVIEMAAGLTDSATAHQPLGARKRVGHEKQPTWPYLIEQRRVHFLVGRGAAVDDTLSYRIPVLHGELDKLPVTLLSWDPPVMQELARRGAHIPDFTHRLDEFIRAMPKLPDAEVRDEYDKLRRFYFEGVADSAREAPIRARLGLPTSHY